ncbi:HD-GYP domain-containing protein [Flexivirga caeni]|uniref:HD domain-containing protein n=1 Tax=Flexivirga caeni TaxID=2294115 RepID=A0A3M9M7I2_9MICO|nr:HD domain-containing phosphohydrolase [Flexivirga caeni]RNI21165.1 HD domain-containing protein [Flexivirga caeni]
MSLAALGVVFVGAAGLQEGFPRDSTPLVLGCSVFAIALASLLRLSLLGGRVSAAVATAIGLGLAFAGPQPVAAAGRVPDSTWQVLITVALGRGVGVFLCRRFFGDRTAPLTRTGSLLAVAVAAVLYRDVPFFAGVSAMDMYGHWGRERWCSATAMAVAGVVAGALMIVVSVHVHRGGRSFRAEFAEVARIQAAVNAAVVSTAIAIALGMSVLGVLAIPLMSAPLVLLRFALQQQAAVVDTRRQTIAALAQLTDIAGYTPAGHSTRVAALCRRIGAELHMTDRDLDELEDAARLHDIGQVSLISPIPGGATIDIAPVDQRGIADEGARIVRRTEVLNGVADIIEAQVVQFREVQEHGEAIPMSARIIKVCNAFEDLTRGNSALRGGAIERLTLGIGYEYDPMVLDLLIKITAPGAQPPAVPPQRDAQARPHTASDGSLAE